MLGPLGIPAQLLTRALDDLHTLAEGVRGLTERGGDIDDLIESVHVLPRVEDELSANIALLRDDIEGLRADVRGLRGEIGPLREAVRGFHSELRDLRDRIPGV